MRGRWRIPTRFRGMNRSPFRGGNMRLARTLGLATGLAVRSRPGNAVRTRSPAAVPRRRSGRGRERRLASSMMVRFGGADDRRGDARPAGHPGERDPCSRHLPLGGDAGDLLDDQPITGRVKVLPNSSVGLRLVSSSQSRVSLPRARGLQGMTPTPRSAHSGSISRSSSRLSRL